MIAAGPLVLEGLYHRGSRRPALLVCPSPGPGGGMDAPPVAELAWAAARAGHPSLRFQHRGRGASPGEADASRALEDAEAALAHLADSSRATVAVAGVGEGCETALALARAHPEVERVALVAPARAPAPPWPRARILALVPEEGARPAAPEIEAALGGAGTVEILTGADPIFRSGLPGLGRAAVAFLLGR